MDLVFDIGGTNFRVALVRDRAVVWQETSPTPNFLSGLEQQEISNKLVTLICGYIESHRSEVDRVGVAFPGPVASDGAVVKSPVVHGPAFVGPFALRSAIEEQSGLSNVAVTNDITAAAYRYASLYEAFCLITVSTGIGNKVMVGGRPLIGPAGEGGEIGHAVVEGLDFSVSCDCGGDANHLCAISSGRGAVQVAKALGAGSLSGLYQASCLHGAAIDERALARGADAGDPFCRSVIDVCARSLAQAACTLCNAIYLQKLVFIGGFYFGCSYYREALADQIVRYGVMGRSERELRDMVASGYSDDFNGLIGLSCMLDALGQEGIR